VKLALFLICTFLRIIFIEAILKTFIAKMRDFETPETINVDLRNYCENYDLKKH